jgi:hypothetical protein
MMRQPTIVGDLAAGAAAGVAATAVMSLVMYAAQQAGLVAKQPPAHLTDSMLEAAGVPPESEPARRAADTLAHLAFGGAAGALYGLTRRAASGILPTVPGGVAWGLLVWLVSYGGWVPALRIMPPPPDDSRGRQLTLLAGHVAYGGTLGALLARRPTA